MIKTVKKIGELKGKYALILDIFEFSPPLVINNSSNSYQFLTGAYYHSDSYPVVALYESDEKGNILNNKPIIHEDGIPKYQSLFKFFGYTITE